MIHDNPMTAASPPLTDEHEQPAKRRSPVTRIVLLLLLVVVVGGTFLLVRGRQKKQAADAAAAASAAANRVVPVLTATVAQRDVPVWLEGLGNVSAFYTVTVKSQVGGQIVDVHFKEGQQVKKGDLLLQIDPRPFAIALQSAQAALARDEANFKNGQLNLDRYKTLSDQKLIATQQYTDQAATVAQLDAQVQSDQAAIASANLNLVYARITSPIDGVTGVRLIDPGNFVQPSDTTGLVVLTQLDPIAVFFTLPQDDLGAITQGMNDGSLQVEARSRDGDKLLGTGKLMVIDNQINQATATVRLKAIFDNPKHLLWPNLFVKARLHTATREHAIVVPAVAVQHGPQGTFAYVVGEDGTAQMRPIGVEAIQGDTAIIAKGLNPGEQVVVEGQAQIRPGSHVQGKPAAAASASGAPGPAGEAPSAPGAPAGTGSGGHKHHGGDTP
jgi:membrane fusion protein, multidrug efflux system